jgi:hypothetical protein
MSGRKSGRGRIRARQHDNIFIFRRRWDGRQSFGTDWMQKMGDDNDPGRKSRDGNEGKRWITDEEMRRNQKAKKVKGRQHGGDEGVHVGFETVTRLRWWKQKSNESANETRFGVNLISRGDSLSLTSVPDLYDYMDVLHGRLI